jgi:hypothetical protein
MKITKFSTIMVLILLVGLLLLGGCTDSPKAPVMMSVEGFVRAVEISRITNWTGVHPLTAIWFEDGRVKYFVKSYPDMVKQGYNNKINYKRVYLANGEFYDMIKGPVEFPEPKEPKPEN